MSAADGPRGTAKLMATAIAAIILWSAAASAQAPQRSVHAYGGPGVGVVFFDAPLAVVAGAAYRTGPNMWALRSALRAQHTAEDLWDVGVLYGRVLGGGKGWIGAGLAAVGGEIEWCTGSFFGAGGCSTDALWPTLGVPVELHLALFPRSARGVDVVAFLNYNERLAFAGLVAAVRVGSAGIQRTAAAATDSNEPAVPALGPDSVLQPGAQLRVTYCGDGCTLPRLRATGRFVELRDGSLRMGSDARVQARVRREGVPGNYGVTELTERALWIDAGEPTLVPFSSGWRTDDDGLLIPVSRATRVEMGAPRSAGAGAVRGIVVGGALGGLGLGLAALIDTGEPNLAMFVAGLGALIGAPPGALIGAIYPGTRWEDARDRLPETPPEPP